MTKDCIVLWYEVETCFSPLVVLAGKSLKP